MIEQVNALLGTGHAFTAEQIEAAVQLSAAEVEAYCRRELDAALEGAVVQIAVIKLNRIGSEGVAALSYSGVSENYLDGYPANIQTLLACKRKLMVL